MSAELKTDALAFAVPQAARSMGVSARTVWSLVKRGELRAVRIGRRVLVEREELLRFLRAKRSGSGIANAAGEVGQR